MKRYLFLFLLSLSCGAQQLIEHNWPDTTTTGGSVQHLYRFCDTSGNITDSGAIISAGITAKALVPFGSASTYSQPGYDPTTTNNCSTISPGSSGFSAVDSTVGDFNWNQPFVVEDIIKYHSGDILNKAVGGNNLWFNLFAGNQGYGLLMFDSSGNTTFHFGVSANNSSIAGGGGAAAFILEADVPAIPDGTTLDIAIVNPGDGVPTDWQLWVNGVLLNWSSTQLTNTGGMGGLLSATASGGTGYANSFAATFSGGGVHCVYPTGTVTASGGVLASVALSGATYGCTGTVTIAFGAGGGTGGSGTVTLNPAVLNTTALFSVGDTTASGAVNQVAGVQISGHAPTAQEIQMRFASTDWYRGVLPAKPTVPQLVTYDNDVCADIDSSVSLILLTRLQQMGYVTLLLDIDSENGSDALYGPQLNGLNLARAGMFQIPIGINNTGGGATTCQGPVQSVTQSPLNTRANYPASNTMYRTTLAAAANSSIVMLFAASAKPLADLIATPADGISALTGRQLIAAKVSAVYQMGGQYPTSGGIPESNFGDDPASTAAEFDLTTGLPFGTVPLELYGVELGDVVITYPGTLNIYPVTSPIYQTWCWFLGSNTSCVPTPGGDTRQSWDSMPVLSLVAPALFAASANGTVTINAVTGDDTWTSTPSNNQFYHTAVSAYILQTLVSSLLWTDPTFRSLR